MSGASDVAGYDFFKWKLSSIVYSFHVVFNSHVVSPLRCGVNRWAIAQERDERLAGASLGRAGVIEIHGKKKHQQWLWWWGKPSYKYYKQSPVTYTIIHNIYIHHVWASPKRRFIIGVCHVLFSIFGFRIAACWCETMVTKEANCRLISVSSKWPIHVPRTAVRPSCNLVPGRRSHMIRLCEPTYCVRNV